MIFRNAYERDRHDGVVFKDDSLTQQHFKYDCDVNLIVERYAKTGVLPDDVLDAAKGVYGDFSEGYDFAELQGKLLKAEAAFNALPSNIRDRFDNDPAKLVSFVADGKNYEEAVKLGLCEKRPVIDKVINEPSADAPAK